MQTSNLNKLKNNLFRNILLVILFFSILGGAFLYFHVIEELPSLEELENPKPLLASNVYSADGEMIGQFFIENRIEVSLDSIPKSLIDALISTEDRKFYEHWGVDLERFIKAMIKNLFFLSREGASTITQQLSKNLYRLRDPDESLFDVGVRKIREWITAVQIEKTYTKNEILEMYLNISYFGRGAYGISMAAKVFFNKKVNDLTITESALLVALLKSSVYFDPIKRYDNAIERRNLVMHNMFDQGVLSREEYDKLKKEPISITREKIKKYTASIAPHFVEYIRQLMEKKSEEYGFDIYKDGLSIYTTLDSRMQRFANQSVKEHFSVFQKTFNDNWKWDNNKALLNSLVEKTIKNRDDYRNEKSTSKRAQILKRLKSDAAFIQSVKEESQRIEVGFVVIDPQTGSIKAMIGGRNEDFGLGLNHVTQIKRQPGSSFKPILYTVAIDNGLFPAYPILNQEFNYNGWSPKNSDGSTGGYTMLRDALAQSMNLVSARLIIENYVPLIELGNYASRMGIKSKLDLVPAISLGTSEVTPLELTSAYSTIANNGINVEPNAILRIVDKDGVLIESSYPKISEAISHETASIITSMMQTVVNKGTAVGVRRFFNKPAAGKTGTTQDFSDAWFVGFTPQLVAGVWVGFDDRRISFTGWYGQGARAAMPIWGRFMQLTYDSLKLPIKGFSLPPDVVNADFCYESIYVYGNPKTYSSQCNGGVITDIINIKDVPGAFGSDIDTLKREFISK